MSARIELAEVDKRFANGVDAVRALSVVIAPANSCRCWAPRAAASLPRCA